MRTRSPALEAAFGALPDRVPPGAPLDAQERWLVAVVLGGLGRYAAAAAALERLAADPRTPVRIAAHAAVTRGAHLRQLGGHAAARRFDALALRSATTPDRSVVTSSGRVPSLTVTQRVLPDDNTPDSAARGADAGLDIGAARIDALVGLAADAIGLGDLTAADRLLAHAVPAAEAHPSWRPRVRAGWVRAELHLVRSRPEGAVAVAEAALTVAEAAGAARHVLKSRLLLAVARGAAGEPAGIVVAELDAVADRCERLGLLPLTWPAALAAADLTKGSNERPDRAAATSPTGGPSGAARRRHAAGLALNALEQRSDPLGKRQMGESVWIPPPLTLL